MSQPLKKFSEFSAALLPFEAEYLLNIHQLQDPEIIGLLKTIDYNSRHPENQRAFPLNIDKRKYSYLKKWIKEKLYAVNVDVFFEWLSEIDRKIMTDGLNSDDEKKIIGQIRQYHKLGFYFIRFYELVQNYHNFLLIRMRQNYYEIAGNFLERFKKQYEHSRKINQRLHQATHDIVRQYAQYDMEAAQWEKWLLEVFYQESLDGLNRYLAVVRLVFLYYNYKDYNRLIEIFEYLEKRFKNGEFYSPRILVNYYANRLLVHSRHNELDKAEIYGYLSTRHQSNDFLYYLVNLCAVLLRKGKHSVALTLLSRSFPELKKTTSVHNRIGFVSYYIQSLWRCGRASEAASYAHNVLQSSREEILMHRWHLFFTSYLMTLLAIENYSEVLSLVKRYKLLDRDKKAQKRAGYIPNLIWIYHLAAYKQLTVSKEQYLKILYESALPCITDAHKFFLMKELCNDLRMHDPVVFDKIKKDLFNTPPLKIAPRFFV